MFSLWFYSLFYKDIKFGKWQKMSQNLCILTEEIMRNESVVGRVFRPKPEKNLFMAILISSTSLAFLIVLIFVLGGGTSFITYVWFKMQWFMLVLAIMVIYFFYYSLLCYWIFPGWLQKRLNNYFIYIGPEGIIRKDYFRSAFIPWSAMSGAILNHSYLGDDGASLSLDLFIRNHKVWNPMLINSYAYGSLWFGLVTYDINDMQLIVNEINTYASKIGYKLN